MDMDSNPRCALLKDVKFEELLWGGLTRDRRRAIQESSQCPSESSSTITRKLYSDFEKLMGDRVELKRLKAFLVDSVCCNNLILCYAALDTFLCHSLNNEKNVPAEETRKMAISIYSVFFKEGASCFVPVDSESLQHLERLLFNTPDHVHIGNKVFLNIQSKFTMELESHLLPAFLNSKIYKNNCLDKSIEVLAHCSLYTIMSNRKTWKIFKRYAMKRDSGIIGGILSNVLAMEEETNREHQLNILFTIAKENALKESREILSRIEFLQKCNGSMRLVDDLTQRVKYLAISHAEPVFDDFTRSVKYYKCLAILYGISIDELVETLRNPLRKEMRRNKTSEIENTRTFRFWEKVKISIAPPKTTEELEEAMSLFSVPRQPSLRHRCSNYADCIQHRRKAKMIVGVEGIFRSSYVLETFSIFLRDFLSEATEFEVIFAFVSEYFQESRYSNSEHLRRLALDVSGICPSVMAHYYYEEESMTSLYNYCLSHFLFCRLRVFQGVQKLQS